MDYIEYKIIDCFCDDHCKNNDIVLMACQRDHIFRKINEDYHDKIKSEETTKRSQLTQDEIDSIKRICIADLKKYIEPAKIYYDDIKNTIKSDYDKSSKRGFWSDVCKNIVGSFLYSILLLFLYGLLRLLINNDPIAQWIRGIAQNPPPTT